MSRLCGAGWEMQSGPGTTPTRRAAYKSQHAGERSCTPNLALACFLPAQGGGNINGGILGKLWMLPLDRLHRGAEAAPTVSLGFSL